MVLRGARRSAPGVRLSALGLRCHARAHARACITRRRRRADVGFFASDERTVARKAIRYLTDHAPQWLRRITVREGQRERRRFWQPGGGCDRNVTSVKALRAMIDYIHANPVRRGLAARAEDWPWSSARWYAGIRPVKLEMDESVLSVLAMG